MKKQEKITVLTFGCRLNALESEKIRVMLESAAAGPAILVNTCAVTAEAERQCKQAVRKLSRENPGTAIYVTGCAATRAPDEIAAIPGVTAVVSNFDKLNATAYGFAADVNEAPVTDLPGLSKGFVQIQTGCNHSCAYCIVSQLRGRNISFPYDRILADTRALTDNGYGEIVLTGVDIAGYMAGDMRISELCTTLLADIPNLRRLRLSSLDPAAPLNKIVDLIKNNRCALPHLHLSMQSGSDTILAKMGRRHNAQTVRELMQYAGGEITFSWDLICGFPGETDELFDETCDLIRELKPIHLHAFPFSPRPGTAAAVMPGQIPREVSKRRVKIATDLANANKREFMQRQIGKTVQVLVEENNIARDDNDIEVVIAGAPIPARTVCDVRITGMSGGKRLWFMGTTK